MRCGIGTRLLCLTKCYLEILTLKVLQWTMEEITYLSRVYVDL